MNIHIFSADDDLTQTHTGCPKTGIFAGIASDNHGEVTRAIDQEAGYFVVQKCHFE